MTVTVHPLFVVIEFLREVPKPSQSIYNRLSSPIQYRTCKNTRNEWYFAKSDVGGLDVNNWGACQHYLFELSQSQCVKILVISAAI